METRDSIIRASRFYAPFPDALGRAARELIRAAGAVPPPRDPTRQTFDRTQDPQRLADWANSLEAIEGDPDLAAAVREVYNVVDGILLPGSPS